MDEKTFRDCLRYVRAEIAERSLKPGPRQHGDYSDKFITALIDRLLEADAGLRNIMDESR